MTAHDRQRLAARYDHANQRAERAAYYGDRAGELIAQGDARRIMRRLTADDAARVDATNTADRARALRYIER